MEWKFFFEDLKSVMTSPQVLTLPDFSSTLRLSLLLSDKDHIFIFSCWRKFFKLQASKLCFSSGYHLQSHGQTEVVNRCSDHISGVLLGSNQKLGSIGWPGLNGVATLHSTPQPNLHLVSWFMGIPLLTSLHTSWEVPCRM